MAGTPPGEPERGIFVWSERNTRQREGIKAFCAATPGRRFRPMPIEDEACHIAGPLGCPATIARDGLGAASGWIMPSMTGGGRAARVAG
ncbi:hypothetical protein QOZ99_001883 [Angulomicrobium amanitiforme]|uniref:Uncharacterized protein n=1 Tax=Ancylobacter amanitiformis TaxID=217069 RepID=A0ABU0LQK0_9HYPH|nr:hypothetical protein [Ancylobacter amanitiformis]